MKKWIALLLCFIILLTTACGTTPVEEAPPAPEVPAAESEQVTAVPEVPESPEIPHYESDLPEAIGQTVLTDAEIAELATSDDIGLLASKINTAADCVRYFKAAEFQWYPFGETGEQFLQQRGGDYFSSARGAAFLLEGDYEEMGFIQLMWPGKGLEFLLYVKQGDTYYSINPVSYLVYSRPSAIKTTYQDQSVDALGQQVLALVGDNYELTTQPLPQRAWNTLYLDGEVLPFKKELDWNTVKAKLSEFSKTVYSEAEIKALVDADLTLVEAAEKISTPQDAVNYLKARGFYVASYPDLAMRYNDIEWARSLSAEFTFEHNAGACGDTSNLMNRLLEGDCDSQGYVTYGNNHSGHIFNYFMQDGLYYFCDFVALFENRSLASRYYPGGSNIQRLQYITDDPMDFGNYYMNSSLLHNDITSPEYIIHLSCYALDGQDSVAGGIPCDPSKQQLSSMRNNIVWHIFDKDVEDDLTLLFIRDGYHIEFAEAPPLSVRPPEVNIPTD